MRDYTVRLVATAFSATVGLVLASTQVGTGGGYYALLLLPPVVAGLFVRLRTAEVFLALALLTTTYGFYFAWRASDYDEARLSVARFIAGYFNAIFQLIALSGVAYLRLLLVGRQSSRTRS